MGTGVTVISEPTPGENFRYTENLAPKPGNPIVINLRVPSVSHLRTGVRELTVAHPIYVGLHIGLKSICKGLKGAAGA